VPERSERNGYNHEGVASYIKDYINDINGVPSNVEKVLNDALNLNPYFKKYLGSYFGDRPALQLASGITNAVAIAKLGMLNISSGLIQFMQFANVGAALNDYGAASKGLQRAMKPNFADRMILKKSGVESNLTMESGSYSRAGNVGKLFKNSTVLFHYLDMLMRQTAILGAYHKAIDEGKSKTEALQYAKVINNKANFDYGVADAPNIFRRGGPLAQVFLQFKKFGIKQMEFIGDLQREGSKGQNLRLWIPLMLISGLFGIPFFGLLNAVWKNIFGTDWEEKIKKTAFEWAGGDKTKQALVKVAMYGAFATDYTGGVDVSNRTGLGDVMPSELKDALGPTIGTILSALGAAAQGNVNETLKAISPGVGNIAQAIAGESLGYRGRVNNVYDDMYERVLKGMGFRLTDEAVSSDIKNITSTEQKEKQAEDKSAIDAYIKDPSNENRAKLIELHITGKRVNQERMNKGKTSLDRSEQGVSKRERVNYQQLNSFSK
jgi:hypothetical protein